MKRNILSIIISALALLSALPTLAEIKTFVEEYTNQASEYDSKVSCRVLALEEVKRLLLEKLGTYLESETEVTNFHRTKDQIVILKAKITADLKDVASSIDKLRQGRQKTKELEETRKKANEALREVEKLQKELKIAKAEKLNLSQYNEAVNRLSATDWFEKGCAFGTAGKNKEGIEAFTRAIELDRKYAGAYNNRGAIYGKLRDYRQAIRDFDRAIEVNPKYADAYFNRGHLYDAIGNHRQAVEDFKIAARLGDKDAQDYLKSKGIGW